MEIINPRLFCDAANPETLACSADSPSNHTQVSEALAVVEYELWLADLILSTRPYPTIRQLRELPK